MQVEDYPHGTHFYVDVADAHVSNYDKAKQNFCIDPTFEGHLQL